MAGRCARRRNVGGVARRASYQLGWRSVAGNIVSFHDALRYTTSIQDGDVCIEFSEEENSAAGRKTYSIGLMGLL